MASTDRMAVLRSVDFGRVDAESVPDLDRRFVRTADFDRFIGPDVQLLIGAKGTGKSAIFDLFARFEATARAAAGSTIDDVVIVTGTGMGDLHEVATGDLENIRSGGSYEDLWRLYIAVKTGFALEGLVERSGGPVRSLLQVVGKLPDRRLGPLLKGLWELLISGSVPGAFGVAGIALSDFENGKLDVNQLLYDEDQILERAGRRAWVLFDKVDELYPTLPGERKTAIEGLLATSMAMRRTYPRIQPRVFLRTDIWADVDLTNKTHLVDKTVTLSWSREQLSTLLVKGAATDDDVRTYLGEWVPELLSNPVEDLPYASVEQALVRLLPATVYPGEKEAGIIDWIFARVTDSQGTAFPRETILLGNQSRDAQLRRGAAASETEGSLIGRESVRDGFTEVSRLRCATYLAEFRHLRAHFRRFQGKTTAEFTRPEVEAMMDGLEPSGVDMFRALHEVGLLRPVDGNETTANRFEVPRLYRQGLGLVIRGRA